MGRISGAILAGALAMQPGAMATGVAAESAAVNTKQSRQEVGIPTTETLSVNSTTNSVKLSHQNLIDGSDYIYIGLLRAKRGLDYNIDYSTGAITLTKPVADKTSLKVGYCYVRAEGIAGSSARLGTSGQWPSLTLQPVFAGNPTQTLPGLKSTQMLTYGVDSLVNMGSSMAISGLWYASAPQDSRDPKARSAIRSLQETPDKTLKSDKLILQNGGLGLGSLNIRLGYQSVGANFTGFDAMRAQGAGQGTDLGVLGKEKGIKRMDAAADLAIGQDNGLSFSTSRVLDRSGDISSNIVGFTGSRFAVSYGMREVSKGFKRFTDLREADNGQLAAESGLRRSMLGLRFAGLGPGWNSFNMSQLSGEGGNVTSTTLTLDLGRFKLSADNRSTSSGFSRMGALDETERSNMALAVRRQFNPQAKPQDVTQADKTQFNGEAGLNRANYMAEWRSGPITASMRTTNVSSITGGLGRTSLNVEGKGHALSWSSQHIDDNFNRLQSLQPIERSAYGNERGMSRTTLAGQATLNGAQLQFGRSQVNDHGAAVLRQSIGIKSPKFTLQAGFRSISPQFGRVVDLADTDRQELARDIGFNRYDYTLNMRPSKSLAIDSRVDNADHQTDGRTRESQRHTIAYTPDNGPQVKILSDSKRQILADGQLIGSSQQSIELRNKLNVGGGYQYIISSDSHTSIDADSAPTSSKIFKTHIAPLNQTRLSMTLDTINAHYEDGKTETVQSLGVRAGVTKGMSIFSLIESVNIGQAAGSGLFGAFGLDWAINPALKVSLNLENVGRGANAGRKNRAFSLNGLLAKRFLLFDNIKIGSAVNTANSRGDQITCDNAFKMEAGLLGGTVTFSNGDKMDPGSRGHRTTRLLSYSSDPNPTRPYHITCSKLHEITPLGEQAVKTAFAADIRIGQQTTIAFKGYTGGKSVTGGLSPLTSANFSLNRTLPNSMTLGAEYTAAVDGKARTRSRGLALSLAGKVSDKADYEFRLGRALIDEAGKADSGTIFRLRYDQKVDENRFISFSAVKSLIGAKPGASPEQNETTARIDLRTVF